MLELRHGKNLDESKVVVIFKTKQDCYSKMWEREGFSSPYFRTWGTKYMETVDYGSYELFYYIINLNIDVDRD